MMPVAVVTDAARTVIGPDDPAAPVRVIIGRRIVEVPMKMMPVMPDPEPAVAKPGAMKGRGASTSEAAAMKGATMAAMAMPATDFGRQSVGGVFRRGHSARVDQRKRLRALATCGR